MIIALDFDGTCVTHEYPEVGKDIGAQRILLKLIANGHKLILFTMRCEDKLADALKWFGRHDIELFGINENPEQKEWTSSPKCYANLYIDDAALGAPLYTPETGRPYIDWLEVEQMLYKNKILSDEIVK